MSVKGGVAAGVSTVAVLLLPAGSAASRDVLVARDAAGGAAVSPLTVVAVPAPAIRVPRIETIASHPQVSGGRVDLRAVNATLRGVVLADQRTWFPLLRAYRSDMEGGAAPGYIGQPSWAYTTPGRYQVHVDSQLVSASTVVVSALLPTVHDGGGSSHVHGWLSATIRVPSGERVTIDQLFADPARGLRAFGNAWRARLRGQKRDCVNGGLFGPYAPTPAYFRRFALTPNGIAIGVHSASACGTWLASVPYGVLRPYLSRLGAELVAGVRKPRFRTPPAGSRAASVVLVQALPDGLELSPATRNALPVRSHFGVSVTVAAQGAARSRVRVTLTVRQAGSTVVRRATIDSIARGRDRSVVFANVGPVRVGGATLRVDVRPLQRGSRWTDSVVYPVSFARGGLSRRVRGIAILGTQAMPAQRTLWPRVDNTVVATNNLGLAVTIENAGGAIRRRVKASLRIDRHHSPIERHGPESWVLTRSVGDMKPGERRAIVFRLPKPIEGGTRTTIWVATSQDAASYPTVFSRN